jgi:polyketide cyclase/dehydrase/lipid transport protein
MTNPAAGIDIDAPIDLVWRVMIDVAAYGEWNPFITRADCPSPPRAGDPIRLHVTFGDGTKVVSPERIRTVQRPYVDSDGVARATLAYVYEGLPSKLGLLSGTRWQQLAQGDGATRYETVEIFSGPLVRLAGPGRVADGFRRHAEALKARAESLAS